MRRGVQNSVGEGAQRQAEGPTEDDERESLKNMVGGIRYAGKER